jgi:hypothetical protein
VPGLPAKHLYKKTNVIAPWQDELFWVGSSYDRDFKDDKPGVAFHEQTYSWLKHFLKLPFTIEDHIAALRPTTVERRPFIGMHPHQTQVGIFNGMGTKGVSLAPYFGKQLAEHVINHHPIMPEADVKAILAGITAIVTAIKKQLTTFETVESCFVFEHLQEVILFFTLITNFLMGSSSTFIIGA